jgi:hypothetical protein
MDDEIRLFAESRPAAPPYGAEARARARERLLRETRGGGTRRLPRFGWQAVAAFGITVTLVGGVAVALSGQGPGRTDAATSVSQATTSFPELDPKPGQFILIESETMFPAFTMGASGSETRHLYRNHRKIWQSVDGSAGGLLYIEGREPLPWPGEKDLPEDAQEWHSGGWHRLASCPEARGARRDDYAYLSTLPTDPDELRERLYRLVGEASKAEVHVRAFDEARELARETYMPRAQRDALFEAMKSIEGVSESPAVADSAGRQGVALGLVSPQTGTREEAIFDPETHVLIGERATVVDAAVAKAPAGSLLAHTAELKVSVVDSLPEVTDASGDDSCTPEPTATVAASAEPTGSPQASATPSGTPESPGSQSTRAPQSGAPQSGAPQSEAPQPDEMQASRPPSGVPDSPPADVTATATPRS